MKFTYYGHSCFCLEIGQKRMLFDPFIKGNPLAKAISLTEIKADYIFLSHAHYDHTNDVFEIAANTKAKVIGNWEVCAWLNKNGLINTHVMNPGGKWKFEFGEVKCVIAQHSSSFADGTYGGVAAGYILKTSAGNLYYSGDTALTLDMKLIPDWAKIDLAVLPIGDDLTMGIEDAITAAGWLNVKSVVGVHYDTFELIRIDHSKAYSDFKLAGLDLHLLDIGSTVNLPLTS